MHAAALAAELGIRKVVIPRARRRVLRLGHADERPAARLLRHPAADARARQRGRASHALLDRSCERLALAQFAREGVESDAGPLHVTTASSATRTRSTASRWRCPKARSTSDAMELIADALPPLIRARVHLPARQPGRVRRRASWSRSAEVGKLEPATLPTDRRHARRALRRRARRTVDYAHRGHPRGRRSTTAALLEPGMGFDGPAIVETRGSTVVVHPGNERDRRRLRQASSSRSHATQTRTVAG